MSSSSSEDEGERQRLREAVQGVSWQHQQNRQQPSVKRRSVNAEEQFGSVSSKETQAFMAHKLAELLESQYEVVETNCVPSPPASNISGSPSPPLTDIQEVADQIQGVKLLQSSQCPISLLTPPPGTHLPAPPPGTQGSSSSEDSEEEERLHQAAITSTELLRHGV